MARKKKYIVTLSDQQRSHLEELIGKGRHPARTITRARILLKSEVGWTDGKVAEALDVGRATVERVRKRFAQGGLEAALYHKEQQRRKERKFDGEGEARLIATACSPPPEGRARWTLKLLAQRMIELGVVDHVCPETVRQTLKKNELKPWQRRSWRLPGRPNAAFVCAMEDVLDVYTRPYDPARPVVCMDETSRQLIGEIWEPLPMKPGRSFRYDHEYRRNGTVNLFLASEPLTGRVQVRVTERRTKVDWAQFVEELVEIDYPEAEQIVLVLDNLNTHVKASLYEAFLPEQAKRIADKLEVHYTPKKGSWLNVAEIELSILERQCLDRRIPTQEALEREVAAWVAARAADPTPVDWHFTADDARIKLKKLYPLIQHG